MQEKGETARQKEKQEMGENDKGRGGLETMKRVRVCVILSAHTHSTALLSSPLGVFRKSTHAGSHNTMTSHLRSVWLTAAHR